MEGLIVVEDPDAVGGLLAGDLRGADSVGDGCGVGAHRDFWPGQAAAAVCRVW